MKILLAASEVTPIIKIGGLGDVIGSLPKALEKLGANVDVIVPYFPSAKFDGLKVYKSIELEVPFDGATHTVSIFNTVLPGSNVDVLLVKNDEFFASGGSNFFANTKSETEMFSFFDRCVVEYIKTKFNTYDLVHCNDWHTGLITHLLVDELGEERPATLFTVHNLMYQGIGDKTLLKEIGIVPGAHPLIDWDVSDGDINFMQQGVTSADFVNTVSESYAREILTPEFGGSLFEMLQAREARVSGILNGIDYSQFPRDYNSLNWEEKKSEHKRALMSRLGLKSDIHSPLFSFVGRIDPNQKGMDILFDSLHELIEKGGSFVLLGKGLPEWEAKLAELAKLPELAGKVSVNLNFDIELANEIYAGSDFLLVPSKYEPCGLIQIISMWYGTLPIVHNVGGLKDTVIDGINGFTFDAYSKEALLEAVDNAFFIYKDRDQLSKMVKAALTADFGWDKSAEKYLELYKKAIKLRLES